MQIKRACILYKASVCCLLPCRNVARLLPGPLRSGVWIAILAVVLAVTGACLDCPLSRQSRQWLGLCAIGMACVLGIGYALGSEKAEPTRDLVQQRTKWHKVAEELGGFVDTGNSLLDRCWWQSAETGANLAPIVEAWIAAAEESLVPLRRFVCSSISKLHRHSGCSVWIVHAHELG